MKIVVFVNRFTNFKLRYSGMLGISAKTYEKMFAEITNWNFLEDFMGYEYDEEQWTLLNWKYFNVIYIDEKVKLKLNADYIQRNAEYKRKFLKQWLISNLFWINDFNFPLYICLIKII